ncbi:MAG: hypothetical protein LBG31_06980 [Prevotellaceae bacterium]|jgi:hypothetical protein|nr:hypothetical protein [Prevotellaceae bacterium]
MKTIFFFFAMVASIATMATQPEPPVYYTGNDEPAASSISGKTAADSLQPAVTVPPPPVERLCENIFSQNIACGIVILQGN